MNRVYHPWWEWESVAAGFYAPTAKGFDTTQAKQAYADFLRDSPRFEAALKRVLAEWPNACEQFLSNESINRIAWLGQASMCIETGVPCWFRAGFQQLTDSEQRAANSLAALYLHRWTQARLDDARSGHGSARRSIHSNLESAGLFG
jgi:hypothetical protein